jgi:hypothetical protein
MYANPAITTGPRPHHYDETWPCFGVPASVLARSNTRQYP